MYIWLLIEVSMFIFRSQGIVHLSKFAFFVIQTKEKGPNLLGKNAKVNLAENSAFFSKT